jgi:hypothetical protein
MIYISALLALSLAVNIYAAYKFKTLVSNSKMTTEASDLLHDITKRGRAVIDIRVIDPENLFIVRKGR